MRAPSHTSLLGLWLARFWRRVHWFIPEPLLEGPREARRGAEAVVAVSLLVALTPPVGFGVGLAYDNLPLSIFSAACHSLFLLVPISLRLFGSLRLTTHIASGLGVLVPLAWMMISGGADGSSTALFVLAPMLGVLVLKSRDGLVWLAVVAVCLGGLAALEVAGVEVPNLMGPEERRMARLTMAALAAALAWGAVTTARATAHAALDALEDANRALATARQDAEAASLAKGRFLANMSHELRTPMNGVIGFSDLLLQDEADEERRAGLETIQRSAQTMVALIDDVLDFSKIEAGRMSLELAPFDLAEVCASAVEMVAHRAHGAEVDVGFAIPEACEVRVRGDAIRLTQILANLLGNAAKFTTEGWIRLSVRAVGPDRFRFDVQDTGIGIDEDALARLFVPFTQAEASISRRFGGTGLGLSIARQLAHAMGGDVRVDSRVGEGSTFSVEVDLEVLEPLPAPRPLQLAGLRVAVRAAPVIEQDLRALLPRLGVEVVQDDAQLLVFDDTAGAPRADDPPRVRVSRVGWPSAPSGAPRSASVQVPLRPRQLASGLTRALGGATSATDQAPAPSQTSLHVLIVEDHPVNQRVTERMLARLGHSSSVASNGHEALARLTAERFDLVLMDCQMPLMDGLEATRVWRAQERGGRVPIVALTANASEAERRACGDAGMDDFIDKPVTLRRLAARLERHRPRASPDENEAA